jgi:hypothetical protein
MSDPFVPALADVQSYLGADAPTWDETTIEDALSAETLAQSRICRVPHATDPDTGADLGPDYPADLAEALYRRVQHNLALRALPLGIQTSLTDMAVSTANVGGTDAEVRRLERPFRKRKVG